LHERWPGTDVVPVLEAELVAVVLALDVPVSETVLVRELVAVVVALDVPVSETVLVSEPVTVVVALDVPVLDNVRVPVLVTLDVPVLITVGAESAVITSSMTRHHPWLKMKRIKLERHPVPHAIFLDLAPMTGATGNLDPMSLDPIGLAWFETSFRVLPCSFLVKCEVG
jgi:hypothetical protein